MTSEEPFAVDANGDVIHVGQWVFWCGDWHEVVDIQWFPWGGMHRSVRLKGFPDAVDPGDVRRDNSLRLAI